MHYGLYLKMTEKYVRPFFLLYKVLVHLVMRIQFKDNIHTGLSNNNRMHCLLLGIIVRGCFLKDPNSDVFMALISLKPPTIHCHFVKQHFYLFI